MIAFFARGVRLVFDSISLIIPILIFVALDIAFNTSWPALVATQPLTPQLISYLLLPPIFWSAVALFCIDSISTLVSSTDMFFSSLPLRTRWENILNFSLRDWAAYMLASFVWYSIFTSIALGTIAFADYNISSLLIKILIIFGVAFASFPLFYSGIALIAFALVLHQFKSVPYRKTLQIIFRSWSRIYRFHAIRALIDITLTSAVPIGVFMLVSNQWVRIATLVVTLGIFIAMTRAASISFKIDLFRELIETAGTHK